MAWGVKRGVYANEAGQGTGPHAAAAAEVSHPAKQGYVQAFAIYIDTMLVCTSTAFLLLSTGMYNTFRVVKEGGTQTLEAVFTGVPGLQPSEGAQFTQAAVESVLPGWGAGFVALALFFFTALAGRLFCGYACPRSILSGTIRGCPIPSGSPLNTSCSRA